MILLTEQNFREEVLEVSGPVLVDFWGAWCRPCHALAPTLDKIDSDCEGVKIGKVNIDEQPGLSAEYKINALPTLVFFKDGKEVERLVGLQNESVLRSTLMNICFLNG